MMKPSQVIGLARFEINDTDSVAYRNTTEELLEYFNDGLCELSIMVPILFSAVGDLSCAEGQTEQSASFSDAQAILDVIRVKDGRAVLPGDMAALSAFRPDWGSDAAGPAQNWFRHQSDPLRFYIYPKAPDDQVLEVKFVAIPHRYAIAELELDVAEVPASVMPAMVRYVVHRAESKDDEHVNSGRSAAAYAAFLALIKAPGG